MLYSYPKIQKKFRGIKFLLKLKKDPLHFFTNVMIEEGSYAWMSVRGQRLLMLNDATGIKHVLQTNRASYVKGKFHQFLRPIFGNGIFLSEGEVWKKQRKNAAPVFSNIRFEEMVRQMVAAMEAMFKRWDVLIAQDKPIDFTLEMTSFTLDALLRALFHEERANVANNMRSILDIILTDTESRVWSVMNLPTFIAHRLPKYFKAKKFLNELVIGLINDRRSNKAYPDDLLSRLIGHYDLPPADQQALQDDVLAFLVSGHDTTSHALSWTFYNLALHTSHRELLVEEIDKALGNATPTLKNLEKLTYARQIFEEVLRLFPPVWSMSREAAEDEEIPLDDGSTIFAPAGTGVMMCHYAVHRRPKYWTDPESFRPERFSPKESELRPAFSYFPFGGGERLCIGFRFAQLESLVALSMITQRYELSLIPGQNITPKPIITLRPSGPMLFNIKKRQPASVAMMPASTQEITSAEDLAIQPSPVESKCPYHQVA